MQDFRMSDLDDYYDGMLAALPQDVPMAMVQLHLVAIGTGRPKGE